MNRENLGISLFILFFQVPFGRVGTEAARIDAHHVDGGFALDDPLGQLPAGTAGSGDTKGVSFIQPEVFKAWRRSE